MTMLNHIRDGIDRAINDDAHSGSVLSTLPRADREHLARAILLALTEAGETHAPAVEVLPADTAVITLTPGQVVANYAVAAQEDMAMRTPEAVSEQITEPGDNYREVRQFLFRVQHMFGVRVRSIINNAQPLFLIAGTRTQINAFVRGTTLIQAAALPVANTLSTAAERREFWATLGDQVCAHDLAEHCIETNRGHVDDASAYLNERYGHVRNLRRTTAADESSPIFSQAAAVASSTTPAATQH